MKRALLFVELFVFLIVTGLMFVGDDYVHVMIMHLFALMLMLAWITNQCPAEFPST